MIANYHTHTPRCHHAVGSEREYIQAALQVGLETLGFSDHSPYFFPSPDYVSRIRMLPEQLSDYCETLTALRDEYASEIDLHIGLEAEYYPSGFAQLLALLRESDVEYLILGQHFLDDEIGAAYCGSPTDDPAILIAYVEQCIQGLETGCYSCLAHPDLLYFTGDHKLYETYMRKLCRCARSCHVPLEINLLGLSQGRHYPYEPFWEIAGQEHVDAILGCDAHRPSGLYMDSWEVQARAMATRCQLHLLDTLPLRPIFHY